MGSGASLFLAVYGLEQGQALRLTLLVRLKVVPAPFQPIFGARQGGHTHSKRTSNQSMKEAAHHGRIFNRRCDHFAEQ